MAYKFCFFCGGHQDYMTLFPLGGEYTNDAQQCSMCVGLVGPQSAAIFEVTDKDPGTDNPIVQPGVWFTGRWTTVSYQTLRHLYPEDIAARVAQARAGTLSWAAYRRHRLDVYRADMLM